MRNKFYFSFLLLLVLNCSYGQHINHEIKFEELVQALFQQQEDNISYEDMYESLLQYYTDPLDINKVTREDLQQLFILSPQQINHFLDYRKSTGAFISLYELQSIPTFDEQTIQKIIPFIRIHSEEEKVRNIFKNLFTNSNHYLLVRSGKNIGKEMDNNLYVGDGNRFYVRYKNSKPRKFSYGITIEKDEGEKNQWNPSRFYYGTDFLSYHFTVFNKGKIKTFSLGDYQMQFGQGLVLSSGFRLGRNSETILTAKKNNSGIKPYTSSMEFGYFRGTAITLYLGPIEYTAFYSNKNIDGTLNEDSSFSPISTGYHRNLTELQKRNKINEQIFGTNISYQDRLKNFHSGLTLVNTRYNYSLQKTPTLYNTFEFKGNNNYSAGTDFSYTYHNSIFFGEAAISQNGGKGMVIGLLSNLSRQLEMSMVYRNYERNFHSFYSNAFGENSQNINEKGIYWGAKLKLSSRWTFSGYYDRFSFPWLKYLVSAPSHGDEYLGDLTYRPNKTTSMSIQYRQENKEKNLIDNTSNIDYPVNTLKRNFLFRLEVKPSQALSFRTKLQLSEYHQFKSSYGYAFINDLEIKFRPCVLSLRYAMFDTDDFNNRQYVYEKDVLYSFSIPSYYGRGTRVYAILKFKLFKNIDTWVKYSKTNYMGKINPEEDGIDPPKSDIRVQIIYTFR